MESSHEQKDSNSVEQLGSATLTHSAEQSTGESATWQGRKSFILVIVAFVLPIIIAKVALEQHWLDYGVTNKGKLVESPIHLKDLSLDGLQETTSSQAPWLMVVSLPSPCESACKNTFASLQKTYIALGKEMPRVTPVALSAQSEQLNELATSRWRVAKMTQALTEAELGEVLIVDPHGNVVLSHELPKEIEALPFVGKAIVADFKKLLKYSRIG